MEVQIVKSMPLLPQEHDRIPIPEDARNSVFGKGTRVS
jgi:hypothetical protein